jgi:hypothetical protein
MGRVAVTGWFGIWPTSRDCNWPHIPDIGDHSGHVTTALGVPSPSRSRA